MRTRGSRVEPIGEILRFVGHQSFAEFHDAHRVRRYAVIAKHEFSDPEIAAADNSPDRKALLVRLDGSALLNVAPAADPLARLRILKHGIRAVDFMFDVEITRIRSIPMALQRRPRGSLIHLRSPDMRGRIRAKLRVPNPDVACRHSSSSFGGQVAHPGYVLLAANRRRSRSGGRDCTARSSP